METAGGGGPWGRALLAAYRVRRNEGKTLDAYLANRVFAGASCVILAPDPEDTQGFESYVKRFTAYFPAERAAVEHL